MPTIDQIKNARTEAVAAINRVLLLAERAGFEDEQLERLDQLKQAIERAVLDGILESDDLRAALPGIRSQAENLKQVAQTMTGVADFNTRIDGLLSQARDIAQKVQKVTGVWV